LKKYQDAADYDNSEPKPRTFLDILLGMGISAVFYVMIWGAFAAGLGLILHLLISLLLVGALMLVVWLFKSERRAAAITMLVMLFVPMLAVVIVGSFALFFFPS
jgi:nitrate reductase NapE component